MMRCCCSCCCFYVTKLAALFDKYAVAALLLSFVWMPQEMSPGAWLDVIVGDDGSREKSDAGKVTRWGWRGERGVDFWSFVSVKEKKRKEPKNNVTRRCVTSIVKRTRHRSRRIIKGKIEKTYLMDKGGDRHLSIQFLIFDCYCDFLNVSRIVPLWEYRRTRPSEKAKRKKKKVSSSLLILSLYYIMCNSAAPFFFPYFFYFSLCARLE